MGEVRRSDLLFPKQSYEIKNACLDVHNTLGCGFLEKVYENALAHELRLRRFEVRQQFPLQVTYADQVVGEFFVDLLVSGRFVIEVKAAEGDHETFRAQLINYLKAVGLQLGFLANFGKESLSFHRVVFTKHKGQ